MLDSSSKLKGTNTCVDQGKAPLFINWVPNGKQRKKDSVNEFNTCSDHPKLLNIANSSFTGKELVEMESCAFNVRKKKNKLFDLGGYAHKQQKNQGHKILRGSAKAYIHEAHPHSTHTMKSMNTTMKNYHTALTISHFSTWHSTPHLDTYNEKKKSFNSY